MIKVIKRNGQEVDFDANKIAIAINKAMHSSTGVYEEGLAEKIASEIETFATTIGKKMSIYDIEDHVYYSLIKYGNPATARAYENYKAVQTFKRLKNTTDESILGLLDKTNLDVINENSNKNAILASTQRDLIAGEVSKDIARRMLIPVDIVQAHDEGAIHLHDMDYLIQPMFNCCLVNIGDMLDNGTVINGKMVETPKSFQVACTVMTQIIAQVASGQFGGQSLNVAHLGKYLRKSYEKHLKLAKEILTDEEDIENIARAMTKKELEAGIQTIQYQINTLMTTNGQSPFVTLFMYVEDGFEYEDEVAQIVEEIIKQRLEGIKNEKGVYITPAFPKLIYVLDENNVREDSKYYYLTKLAAKCTAKRMYPDYISAKKLREHYEGNVFGPMGCRSFLAPYKDENGNYKFEGRFNQGVVSLNLPQIGILNTGNEEGFFEMLEKRLDIVKKALLFRNSLLQNVKSDNSPIHWQYGAIARLKKGESIKKYLTNGYSTLSVGYIGMYEATMCVKGVSHTTKEGKEFALKVMKKIKEAADAWSEETGMAFSLYGTPAESLTHRFCSIDKKKYGEIKDITDKGYYTNSYHVDVRENISVFDKFKFEEDFQKLSTGGCISYAEIPNMNNNVEAIEQMIRFIYDNIQYAEFNTKSDYCHVCGFDGEIIINDYNEWECPQCHNKDKQKMNVTRRTCGYLGENFWNEGRTKEIKARVLHI
ncbi:anaerobic ribonucleoside-triphosphate reductase [uncultured Parvimonas sp.]|uniref:anaerobic ribonucleoside-triphosphate reductase n=1 Tax=uncultured Parvimonas sp. TaxID=747372 RepID=UPI0025974222|nr:anaerobic ribonucleoside-triphosphate reductase [uncultured Parvimonas sp.]